jgi:predicted ATPase with chaperone activity
MSQMNLSARAYHRILKLARTIADLAENEEIQSTHLVVASRLEVARRINDLMGWYTLHTSYTI